MMQKITRWVFGTATARVSGDTARFLNVAVRSGVVPLEAARDGDSLRLTVRARPFSAGPAVPRCGFLPGHDLGVLKAVEFR